MNKNLQQPLGLRSPACSLSVDSSKSHIGDVKCGFAQLVGPRSRPSCRGLAKSFLVSLIRATNLALEFHVTHSQEQSRERKV